LKGWIRVRREQLESECRVRFEPPRAAAFSSRARGGPTSGSRARGPACGRGREGSGSFRRSFRFPRPNRAPVRAVFVWTGRLVGAR
jgi:hypothetical protein